VEHLGRDRVAAVAGVLFVVALVVGQYVAPDLVYPEEQVGGVQLTFYVNYEDQLLAQAILFGVASMLLLVFVGGLRAFLARAEGQDPRLAPVVVAAGAVGPPGWCCCGPPSWSP
jgi:ABC-type spermidine/putrescine transport system permease subunit I